MAVQFDPSKPFEVVPTETLDSLVMPKAAPVPARPAAAVFDPSLPFEPVAEPSTDNRPTFDPNQPVIKVYGLDEFTAKPAEELVADKDFMPVEFGKLFETELDPAQRTKLEQVYAARESSGTSVADKVKSAFTGIFPAIKTLGEGVKSAAKLAQKFTPVGIAQRLIEKSPQEVIDDYAKSATEATASVELAALGSIDLIRRSKRAVEEGVANLIPSDVTEIAGMAGVPGVRRAKADMTEGDWRKRLSDDIAAAKQVEVAGQGNGAVMEGLGIDAATLEKDFGIVVDPEEISRLSVVTDPINYIPLGATVGWIGKLGGKAARGAIAVTRTTEQAKKLAGILNSATQAANVTKSGAGQVAGAAAKAVGGVIQSVGNVAEKGVRALGGTASGVGLGGLLGGNVYTALGGAAIAKGVPRVTQAIGQTISGAGKILTGEAVAPAALTLAGETVRGAVSGAVKGAAEGGLLILPFEIGARPEEEEQLLGMVGLGALTRAGAEGAAPGAKAAGRVAQNKLAESIFQRVEQEPLGESSTYGTDPLLDSTHAANVSKLAPSEQKLVNWGRELLRAAGGEVYVLDNAAFNRETGSKTAHGYAVNIGEKIAPDGTSTPVFRIFLNQSAEAVPHEFFHALTDLDPKRAADFRDTVKASLTPDQLKSFEQLYNSRLNGGLPEAQWKRRLTPEQVMNEAAAETFSRLFLSQDLTGVEPKVTQKAALFVSSLLEKLGAPLGKVGAKAGEAGVSTLGVRPGAESAKAGQAWIANMLQRVNDEGTLGQPPILPERPVNQTLIPSEVVRAKPVTAKPTPAAPPPPTVPTPVNPPLPAAPAPTARNIRAPRASQDDFAGRRAEVTNVDAARAAAEATGDANTIARVSEISDLIESGSPVIEIEHFGARATGTADAPSGRTTRRAEQEAAYIAEGMGAAPQSIREAYQKVFVPVRWEIIAGKPQLLAMSLDKVIANTHKLVKESAARGVEGRIPYEITDGKLTDNAWGQVVDDLKAYAENQANGYRGDGQKLTRPTTDVGLSIPAENPAYNPRPITEERANFLNAVQGLNPPLTARVGKQSSAVLPGNVKGQILAEANLRTPERPSVIRPEDITKQDFKSQPGRSIAETNPLRNELAAAGVPVRELIEITERINARDINSVRSRPELEFKAPVTDIIRGGFLPQEETIRAAASRTRDGQIFEGPTHFDTLDKAKAAGKDISEMGFVTNEGRFVNRDEAAQIGEAAAQLKPDADVSEGAHASDFDGFFLPSDAPTSEVISDVLKMDAAGFNAAAKSWEGGQRNRAYDLGLSTKSLEEVALLKDAQEAASADRKRFMAAKDIDNGVASALKAQFFREAYEAATDTGGAAGEIGWRQAFPDRVAPFPESKPVGQLLPSAEELNKVKSGEKDGETFNRDGTVFSPGDRKLDVVTLASENLPASELSPKRVQSFLSKYPALFESDSVKPGIFRMANGDISIDLNVVVDQTHRANTEAFARANNQQAIFDLVSFESVNTGGNGQTVLTTPESIADAARKLERGEPVTVSGEPAGDFLPTMAELEAKWARAAKTKPKKSTKQTKANPTAWILPDGEVKPISTTYHEQDLVNSRADYNKRFGTSFGSEANVEDRVAALSKGFVRMRYAPENGRMAVEVGAGSWGKQKSKVLDTLLSQSEKIDTLAINLIDENGKAVDSVSDRVFNAADKGAAITDLVNEIVAPRTTRARGVGPSDIQRMRALPGAGDFLPSDLLGAEIPDEAGLNQKRVRARVREASQSFPEALVPEYRRNEDGSFIIGDDGKPRKVEVEYDLMGTPLARSAAKGQRGEAREEAFTSALADKLVSSAKQAAKNKNIQAGSKWYSTTRSRLRNLLGDDTKFFTELLGATSARTPVDTNFRFAMDAYNQFKSGAYDDIIGKYREGKTAWDQGQIADYVEATGNENPNRGQFLDWWVIENGLAPVQSNGKKFGMNSRAVLRVLDGSWREEVQGPKTPNFAGNLSGDTFEATIDVWAARLLHRLANENNTKRWRILPENETGVTDADFALGQSAFRKAAEKLKMKPDSLQAVLWFFEKDHWEKKGWTGSAGAAKSDFQSLLSETVRTESGQLRRMGPQNELAFALEASDIEKSK